MKTKTPKSFCFLLAPFALTAQLSFAEEAEVTYAADELRETLTEIFGTTFTDQYTDSELEYQAYDLLSAELEDGSALLVSRASAAIAIQEVTGEPVPDALFENLMLYALDSDLQDEQLTSLELLAGQMHPDNLIYLGQFLNEADSDVRKEAVYQLASLSADEYASDSARDLLLNHTLVNPQEITDLLISELSVTDSE